MNESQRFAVSGPNIVHEVIEGEVVIVNMNNGFYFSSEKLGCLVWRLVESGASFGEILDILATHYPGKRSDIEQSVGKMISELDAEGLVVSLDGSPAGELPIGLFDGIEGSEFVAPVLHKHKDMQDLLLVDPIHEVEDSGWPNTT